MLVWSLEISEMRVMRSRSPCSSVSFLSFLSFQLPVLSFSLVFEYEVGQGAWQKVCRNTLTFDLMSCKRDQLSTRVNLKTNATELLEDVRTDRCSDVLLTLACPCLDKDTKLLL